MSDIFISYASEDRGRAQEARGDFDRPGAGRVVGSKDSVREVV